MGFIDILMGRRPQLASTPPFVPGGRPGISMIPSQPGVIDFLRDGIAAAATPNIAGGGALDTMRAIASGMGSAQQRQNQQLQQQLSIAEFGRKLENDAILAAARQAEAEADLARANLANRNASRVEPTIKEKFEMASKLPGITPEQAAMWALGGHITAPPPPPATVELDPEVAAYSGLSVPKVMKPVPTQVPTTDPLNDPRVTDVMKETYGGPIRVPSSVAITATQNWGRKNSQQSKPSQQQKPLRTDRVETSSGLEYVQLNPDGTINRIETGVKPIDKRIRRQGSGSGSGKPMTPAQAASIERSKQSEFKGILDKLEKDDALENPDFYIEQALDAQRRYEEKIIAGGGDVSEEQSQQNADAIRESFLYRINAKKARLEGKPVPQFTPRRRAPGTAIPSVGAPTAGRPSDPLGIRR